MSDVPELKAPVRVADAEGSMEHAPLVYALVHALDRMITGEMVFRTPEGEAHTVTFFEGAAVRVEPGLEGERVGEELVAMDHLREDALIAALAEAETSRKRLGDLLVQAGSVDAATLTHTLALQTGTRLGLLSNLPPTSRFSIYFSARAEPEPYAPWAPLDMLLAAIRAWEDCSRLHATVRWLSDKKLGLAADSDLESLMLTSREREAVALMRRDSPSLKTLYATVGKGLSSLLYMLAVTRQFSFSAVKGRPMGRRKESDLISDAVRSAMPSSPVIISAPEPADEAGETSAEERPPSEPPAEDAAVALPVLVPESPPPYAPPPPALVPAFVVATPPSAPPVAVAPPPPAEPQATPPRPPPRPSFSPPKTAPPAPKQARTGQASALLGSASMSAEFRRAEDAARRVDFETADRILRERCPEEDTAEPDFQALSHWVKANHGKRDAGTALNDLTFLLMAHSTCESALYYRGLLLKRTGKDKAALRDFIVLAKMNPGFSAVLSEIKLLRDGKKS